MRMAGPINEPFIRLVYIAPHALLRKHAYASMYCLDRNISSGKQMQSITEPFDMFLHKANQACRPSAVALPIGISVEA